MRPPISVSLIAGFVLALALPAVDWPMGGRDNSRNPVSPEKGAPTDWTLPDAGGKGGRNVKWTAGLGYHSPGGPVVSGGLVWVGTCVRLGGSGTPLNVLACFRERDGVPLYQYLSHPRGRHRYAAGLSGSPLAEGDRLYFRADGEVVCLDTGPLIRGEGDPRVLWKVDLEKQFGVPNNFLHIAGHDTHGSPAASGDYLYVPTGVVGGENPPRKIGPPSLVCLRKDTGKLVWKDVAPRCDLFFGHYSSPTACRMGGRDQVVHAQADGWVRSFAGATGKLLWEFDANPKAAKPFRLGQAEGTLTRHAVFASPVFADGRLFFALGETVENGSDVGRIFCVDPTKSDDVSPELEAGERLGKPNPNSALIWQFAADWWGEVHVTRGPVAVSGGLAIVSDSYGYVHCLDARTGTRDWHDDIKSRTTPPLIVDNTIYVGNEDGDLFVFALSRVKRQIAKNTLDRQLVAAPVFANGTLYVLAEGSLHAVRAGK